MSIKVFLDTNLFVYSIDHRRDEKARLALNLIREHSAAGTGVISFQVIQEFLNVVFKRLNSPMRPADAALYLTEVLKPLLSVQSSAALYADAISIHMRHKASWYDSLILAAAAEARCAVVLTEDMQHKAVIAGVRIENPFIHLPK